MATWIVTGQAVGKHLRLRVRDCFGEELLRAALPLVAENPRALLIMLEGLALWAGEPLRAVIYAADSAAPTPGRGVSRIETSALVRLEWVLAKPQQRRLRLRSRRPAGWVEF